MDQVKEYLGYAVKYRFWIAVAIAALLPLAGYFASAGAIEEETTKQEGTIKSSFEEVKKFASNPAPVNDQYPPLVAQKTQVLSKDVRASWEKLFERQAELLTWPEAVADRFPVWGPKWPEGQAPNVIRQAATDYVETFENYYLNQVYKKFNPFDYETGDGIVKAPTARALLRPPTFSVASPPTLGEVWDTQRRFWVQAAVLDVVAKVNERAKAQSWEQAPIKQILALEVASPQAQDQKSIAQGKALQEAPAIKDPNAPEAAADGTAEGGVGAQAAGNQQMMQMMGAMGGGPGGRGGMGGMGGGQAMAPEKFMILESANPEQAFIVPIHLSVYIEQDRIPDLLVEFQNSPTTIEVLEFSMLKPQPHSVKKPEKGEQPEGFGFGEGGMMEGYGGMGGQQQMMMMMGGRGGMGMMNEMMEGGYGGNMNMQAMMGGQGMAGGYGNMNMQSMMMGRMGGMGATPEVKKKTGVDRRSESLKKLEKSSKKGKAEEANEEEARKATDTSGPDPYYNVVRVEIYGRARFYLPPPPAEEARSEAAVTEDAGEPSDAEAAPADDAEMTPAEIDQPGTPDESADAAPAPDAAAEEAPPTDAPDVVTTPAQPPADASADEPETPDPGVEAPE